jgi:PAS domain S-box-containing protein
MCVSTAPYESVTATDDGNLLLIRRLRAGFGIVLLSVASFAVADSLTGRSAHPLLPIIQALQLTIVASGLGALHFPRIRPHAMSLALVVISFVSVTTAAASAVTSDPFTMSLLFIVMAMGTATVLPWGAEPQVATVVVATIAWLAGVYADGAWSADLAYSGLAMLIAFVASVYVADQLDRHRRALEKNNRALAEAQELAKVGSWEWNIAKDEVLWSDELYRIYGLSPQEFTATYGGFLERVHVDDRPLVRAAVERSLRNGEPFAFDHRIVRPDRTVCVLHAKGNVVRDASGRPVRMFGTGQDITERKQAEDEVARARDEAENASELKSAFLANMSHEIRTPLNIILGYSQLMVTHLEEIGDDSQKDFRDGILRAGHRLMATIEAILDFSRIEARAFEINPTSIELGPLIEKHLRDLRPLASAKGLFLSFEVHVPQARIVCDEYCLSSALLNLLQNAIKFTEHGRVDVRLYQDSAGTFRVDVRDTGIGIDPAFFGRLFEPFTQEDLGRNRKFEGSGLGLALTKRYLEMNGASISLESHKGLGSTFTIRFAAESLGHENEVATPSRPGMEADRRSPDASVVRAVLGGTPPSR